MTKLETSLPHWSAANLSGVAHGFFGAQGGVSAGIYSSLNAGFGSEDHPDAIAENRRRIAEAFGSGTLLSLHQVHSATALFVARPLRGPRAEADAMVCVESDIILSILTADCAPVLLYEPDARVIGAAHAGWKGALGGVLESTLTLMQRKGAQRNRIRAAIGPCIHQQSYEVGADYRETVLALDPRSKPFFADGESGKFQFDLPGYAALRLTEAGVTNIETIPIDTYAEKDACFSNRRALHLNQADYGRNCSAIKL